MMSRLFLTCSVIMMIYAASIHASYGGMRNSYGNHAPAPITVPVPVPVPMPQSYAPSYAPSYATPAPPAAPMVMVNTTVVRPPRTDVIALVDDVLALVEMGRFLGQINTLRLRDSGELPQLFPETDDA